MNSKRRSVPRFRRSALAGPRDDLKVLTALKEPMTLPVLEHRLAQAGHRIGAARLRTLLTELQDAEFLQRSGLDTQPVFRRTARGTRLCPPRATSPSPA